MDPFDAVVIGAGPGGLFCALHAAASKRRVLLLEKNSRPGAKLLLAGSGQCNITHAGDIRQFPRHYGAADHGRFVRPALMALTNDQLIRFFSDRGLGMVTEENGKVFPTTRRSSDVLAVLLDECGKQGVILRCGEPVQSVSRDGSGFTITTGSARYHAKAVVIATGGESYPKCGTTGDGYRLAAGLGQPVTETTPALTPLIIRDYPFGSLAGMSFEQMPFSIWRDNKKVAGYLGDVLFTHAGLSGPGILDASRDVRSGDEIRLSFVGTLRREEFAADLATRAPENPGWFIGTLIAKYPIPERLIRQLIRISGIPERLTCAHFPADLRSRLVTNCTALPLTIASKGDFPIAMVTRGGIALPAVNPRTMESRIVPGLFFAGEVLDIDGDTGGYNLQAAFSTGFLAALGMGKSLLP